MLPNNYLVSIQKWPFSAISSSIGGIVCAAHKLYASAQSLDFLDLAKNCSFLNWKLTLVPILPFGHFWMGTTYSKNMNLDLLKQVNRLWHRIYPYLAAQIFEIYQKDFGKMLELGPFSGGISFEMAKRHGAIDITLADEDPKVLEYFEQEMRGEALSASIGTERTAYAPLIFDDGIFDLVVCRGAFFFLDEEGSLLQEISRVLNKSGVAFVGGGFGKNTPRQLINEIADESRDLNDLLGRKRFTVEDLEAIIDRSGLSGIARIVQEGGLWVILDKSS